MVKKGENIFRVIFLEAIFLKIADYLERTQRRTVRTGRCHGIVHICNCHNHSVVIDKIFRKSRWIAGSIATLVVHEGGLFDTGIQIVLSFQDFISQLWMLFYLGKFFIGKSSGLVQNFIWNQQLTNVMQ